MTDAQKIAGLLYRYLAENLSEEESLELEAWSRLSSRNSRFLEELKNEEQLQRFIAEYHPENRPDVEQNIYSKIQEAIPELQTKTAVRKISLLKYIAAASVLVILAISVYRTNQNAEKTQVTSTPLVNVEAPGHDGAILTLADGSQMVLDSLQNGVVANQGGTQVKLRNGQLNYSNALSPSDRREESVILYNTMSTPRGRQFQLTLPDGTNVRLNAESSIKFPTVFSGTNREVEITGEAYFEVVHNERSPFKVYYSAIPGTPRQGQVEVLGTHFNVNAYPNEKNVVTTLISGSVKMNQGPASAYLKPGQQGIISVGKTTGKSEQIKVISANTEQAMAWKNGLFYFKDADVQTVMRHLQRWYNVEVVYEGDIPARSFQGKIERNLNLSDVLAFLKEAEVHFRVEKNKLIVYP